MSDFVFDDNGWAVYSVTESMVAIAKGRVAEQHRDGARFGKEFPGHEWIGFLAEECVRDLFVASGIECVADGGVNGEPDLTVAGVGVEVKAQGITTGPFRPGYQIRYLAHGLHKPVPRGLIFCVHHSAENTLAVLGSKPASEFFTEARFYRTGDEIEQGFTAKADYFVLLAEALTPIQQLIDRLKPKGTPNGE